MSQMLKGKFYVRLVLTLLLFSIFPMIFLAISIYAYSSNLLKSEINNSIYLLQEQAKEKWDANMESIQTDMKFLHNLRMSSVEEAQQRIVSTIRRLEEEGEIVISKDGKDEVIV